MNEGNVQSPKKSKKTIVTVVLSLLAVAVIGAVVYFGTTGNWFQGAIRGFGVTQERSTPPSPPATGDTLKLYVASEVGNLGCDLPQYEQGYESGCPLTSLKEAVDEAYKTENASYSKVSIFIKEYDEFNETGTITLKDKNFNIESNQAKFNGNLIFQIETATKLKGLVFNEFDNSDKSIININIPLRSGIIVSLQDLVMDYAHAKEVINIIGGNYDNSVQITNCMFFGNDVKNVIHATKNIILNINNSKFVHNIASGNAVIFADQYLTATNNLFINSQVGTKSIIELTSGATSLIAHNTFYKNSVFLAAADKPEDNGAVIKMMGSGGAQRVLNNLIANSDVLIRASDWVNVGGNILYGWKVAPFYNNSAKPSNLDCAPVFETNSNDHTPEYYKLKAGTCGIDQGWDVPEVHTDYFGTSRPQGTKYDIGFHEAPASAFFIPQGGLIHEDFTIPLQAVCGNDIKETGETCDDGNKISGDGCSATCTLEFTPMPTAFCGNGLTSSGEECDDSNTIDGDGCSSDCEEENGWSCNNAEPSVCIEKSTPTTDCEWLDEDDIDESELFIIEKICEDGIMVGGSDGYYHPNDILTREELVKIAVVNSGGEPDESDASKCFTDIDKNAWSAKWICWAKDHGIVEGYDDGTFKPTKDVTVSEALKMLMVATDKEVDTSGVCWDCKILQEAKDKEWLPYSGNLADLGRIELPRDKAANMNWRILYWEVE